MTLIFIYWSFSVFHRTSRCWTPHTPHEFWTPLSRSPTWTKGTSKLSTAPARAQRALAQRAKEESGTKQIRWTSSWMPCVVELPTICGRRGPRKNPLLHRQSVSTETETDKTCLNSLICQCFIQIYIWAKLSLYFYRWVSGFTGVLPQWQVKSYVTVTQTRVPPCSLLIQGFNISWQLTYFLTNIFHHKMGWILASPPSRFLESSLAVGPERNAVRNIVENGERRTAKWVSPWESPECQNRTPASAFLRLSFRLDPIICKYCNYCRAERRALHKWAWVQ